MKDKVLVGRVNACIGNTRWDAQRLFITWFARWLTHIQQWGSTCRCPDNIERSAANLPVECWKKGRLMHAAYDHASGELAKGRMEAESCGVDKFDNDYVLLNQAQGSVKAACGLALDQIAYLDCIPYLIARVGRPGIAQRCNALFDGTAFEHPHPVSIELLGHGSHLRPLIESVPPEGGHAIAPSVG